MQQYVLTVNGFSFCQWYWFHTIISFHSPLLFAPALLSEISQDEHFYHKTSNYLKLECSINEIAQKKQRDFIFSLENDDPIVSPTVIDVANSEDTITTVHLKGFKQPYENNAPHNLRK